jgi:antitoxin HigA-1
MMRTTSAARTITESIPRRADSLGPAIHPGEILLEEFLKPLAMTQAAAATSLGMSTVRLNELVRGKRGVTADTALRLAEFFKTTPQFWMHLQANFDLKAAAMRRRALKLEKKP